MWTRKRKTNSLLSLSPKGTKPWRFLSRHRNDDLKAYQKGKRKPEFSTRAEHGLSDHDCRMWALVTTNTLQAQRQLNCSLLSMQCQHWWSTEQTPPSIQLPTQSKRGQEGLSATAYVHVWKSQSAWCGTSSEGQILNEESERGWVHRKTILSPPWIQSCVSASCLELGPTNEWCTFS